VIWQTREGSTGRLLQLCFWYFSFYVVTGVTVKYFLSPGEGHPGMAGVEFLVYSTVGGMAIALTVALAARWYRMESIRPVRWGRVTFPSELFYILPSGVCTAVVIPTTTLMYTLPISVMVAMVIMRGSVIVISRAVDAIQIRQGLLHKRVYPEENIAVLFAMGAVAIHTVFAGGGSFDFVHSRPALIILGSYIAAYSLRIYIMNYYKNTRGKGKKLNNKAFFAVEQIAASVTLVTAAVLVYFSPSLFGWSSDVLDLYRGAIAEPLPQWPSAIVAGMAFGAVSFFSVFLFMFKGRTATFAGLVNRLTSLIAGTVATLIFHYAFGGRFPASQDWLSLVFILVAIGFLSLSERKRVQELTREQEIEEGAPARAARMKV